MLVWLDSFEVLAPRRQESSSTLTESTAATQDAAIVQEAPKVPARESADTPTPKRRRRPNQRRSGEAPT